MSGIWKQHDYRKGHFETAPFNDDSKRSIYHQRSLEVFRLKQLQAGTSENRFDIFMSHDWPKGIHQYGDEEYLGRRKPHFVSQMETGSLGSPACAEVLYHLKPKYWFAAHMHVKFSAEVMHTQKKSDEEKKEPNPLTTRFLALDKVLPNRDYLQILTLDDNIPKAALNLLSSTYSDSEDEENSKPDDSVDTSGTSTLPKASSLFNDLPGKEEVNIKIYHDAEWLAVLRKTDFLWSDTVQAPRMPTFGVDDVYEFKATENDIQDVNNRFDNDLQIYPEQFIKTCPESNGGIRADFNPQTYEFCDKLDICKGLFGREKETDS